MWHAKPSKKSPALRSASNKSMLNIKHYILTLAPEIHLTCRLVRSAFRKEVWGCVKPTTESRAFRLVSDKNTINIETCRDYISRSILHMHIPTRKFRHVGLGRRQARLNIASSTSCFQEDKYTQPYITTRQVQLHTYTSKSQSRVHNVASALPLCKFLMQSTVEDIR